MKKIVILICFIAIIALPAYIGYRLSNSFGSILVTTPGVTMPVKGGFFSGSKVVSSGEEVQLRVGTYRPERIDIKKKYNGAEWQVMSRGPWGELGKMKIHSESTTNIELGEPLTVKANFNRNGKIVDFGVSVIGKSGERYMPVVLKNGKTTEAPSVTIVNEEKNMIVNGKFRYG